MTEDESAAELYRAIDRYGEEMNARLDSLLEDLSRLNQTLDRSMFEVRDEMRRGFAETWASIRSANPSARWEQYDKRLL